MLHDLLKIKHIREQSAEREVRKCQSQLEKAQQEVKNRQTAFEEYVEWRVQEEKRLYDNIINAEIHQNDLDKLKQEVAILREKDVTLEQAIAEAEKEVEVAKLALLEAQQQHAKAMQAVEKFEEFTKIQDEEAKKEAERLEDLEMEEFTVRPRF